jgi:hypothetical protein
MGPEIVLILGHGLGMQRLAIERANGFRDIRPKRCGLDVPRARILFDSFLHHRFGGPTISRVISLATATTFLAVCMVPGIPSVQQ